MKKQFKFLKKSALAPVSYMSRFIKSKPKQIGLPPGSLIYTGEKIAGEVKITLIEYKDDLLREKTVDNFEEIGKTKEKETISWINVDGLNDVSLLEQFGNYFEIHPLVLEDILNTSQRPKFEEHDEHLFVVQNMLYYDEERQMVTTEQVSLVVGKNYILSFQETIGDVFEGVRERIRKGKGKIRKNGADYLAYALIDAVVDSYFHVLEKISEDIEELEEEIIKGADNESLATIHKQRREMILLRKSVWPLREVISGLLREDSKLIKKNTRMYLRDVYDHTIQVIDIIESFRDIISGMLDTYLTSISNKMNQVMKVLTIIATIFIPLTFIAGVYGMNFDHFPELHWNWMYPWGFWVTILITGALMFLFFKTRKWL